MTLPLSHDFLQGAQRLGLSRVQEPALLELVEQIRRALPPEGTELAGGLILLDDKLKKAEGLVLQALEQGFAEGRDLDQIATDIKRRYGVK